MGSVLHHITPLISNSLGGGHTHTQHTHTRKHTHTHILTIRTRSTLRNQAHAWFNNLLGVSWVVLWGTLLYDSRKLANHWECVWPSCSLAFVAFLKVWTSLSMVPFVEGCYGALLMCFVPFILVNAANSSHTNWGTLSDTICSGNP